MFKALVRRVMLACGVEPALATWDVVDADYHVHDGYRDAAGRRVLATTTLKATVTWRAWWATAADLDAAMQAAADRFAAATAEYGVSVVMHPVEE